MGEPFDVHEYAKRMFDALDRDSERTMGTVTGRFPSRPPLPYNFPPTNVREAMAVLDGSPTMLGLDMAKAEARTIGYLMTFVDGKPSYKAILDNEMYRGKEATLCILDDVLAIDDRDWHHIETIIKLQHSEPREFREFYGKPEMVKQDGRSAAYLKHDKTKKHKRRR